MTSPPPTAAADWLETTLRAHAREHDVYVDDEGFTARVMAALPAPASLPAWRKPALMMLWAAAGLGTAFVLPGTVADAAHDVLRMVAGQRLGLVEVGVAALAFGAVTWTAAAVALRRE